MESWAASVITALIGGMVVTVGYAFTAFRRNGRNGRGRDRNGQADHLLEVFLDNQERVVQVQERLGNMQERILDGLIKNGELLQRLVDVHNKTEPVIERLENFMRARMGGKD